MLALAGLAGLVAVPSPASAWTPHAPIVINGNAEFTGANGVTGGSGTAADPYRIEGWEIDASFATGIMIANTDAYALVRGVLVHSGDVSYDGIFLDTVANVVVEGGVFDGNGYGIVAYASSAVTIANNQVANSFWEGILVDSSSYVTVRGNDAQFDAQYGIDVWMSTDVEVRENIALYNDFAGINLYNAERVVIADNNASSNTVLGIALDFAANVTISGNDLWDNEYGVDVLDSRDLIVSGNTIGASIMDAVTLGTVNNVTLDLNVFTSNEGGVFASFATDMTVAQNVFSNNVFQGGDDFGTRTAWDAGYPAGGNFWSDYAGVDNCSGPNQDVCPIPDGIGDSPYAIDADTWDRYPLMQPFGTGRPGYTVTVIPPLPGDLFTIPWGVNATGAVVGWSTDGSVTRPFLFTDTGGTVELLVTGNRTRGLARDVNAAGVTVGELSSPDPGHAFRWSSGPAPQDLGVLGPGPMSEAWGVNATGAVVGGSDYGGFSPHAFLYTDAAGMIDITPNQNSGRAYDVTDGGHVVGYMSAGGGLRAFRWVDGFLEDLGVPGGFAHSFGFAVNEVGQVAGCADSASGNTERIVRFTDGIGWEILGGAGETNCAWGINAYGDVVGNGLPTGVGILRAFLFTDAGGMQDLERMIDPALMLRLLAATDINNRGQIVGYAWDNTVPQYRGFRLEPTVPQPPNHAPTVAVLVPNGGDFWGGGSTRLVEWRMTDLEDGLLAVTADLSVDGGLTFPYPMFSESSGQGRKTHAWTVPAVVTTTARVRICVSDSEGLSACDTSDANFTIDPSAVVISIDTSPTGFPVRVDGVNHTAPYQLGCAPTTTHSVEVAAAQPINQFSRYGFVGWSDGGALAHDIVCDADRTITASYQLEWSVELDTIPMGLDLVYDGFQVSTPQGIWCAAGSVHDLEAPSPNVGALPDVRYVFNRWMEDMSTQNPRTHTCNGAARYTAVYDVEYRLILDTSPTGLTVVQDGVNLTAPTSTWCPDLSIHTIGAPSPQFLGGDRYEFSSWSDGGAQIHPMMCLAPATITAFFLGPFLTGPSVTLTSPNGGEDWTGGSSHPVTWTMGDPDDATLTVSVDLSTDGGATFPFPLFSGTLPIGPQAYSGALPLLTTATARIRVCVVDGGGQSACDVSDADFVIDSTRPVVVAVLPPDGATNVDPDVSIVLTFNEPMDRPATEAAVSIAPAPGPLVYAWDVTNQVLTIQTPSLTPDTVHTVTVGCGAQDDSDPGNSLQGCPWSSTFTTGLAAEPPQVTVTSPAGGEVWTGGTTHPIDWTMADPDTPGPLSVDVAYSADGGATWTPIVSAMRPQGANAYLWLVPPIDATAVSVRVCASDGARIGCATSPPFAIDSASPFILSVAPSDGAANVALGTPVVVTFTEPMNAATFPMPPIAFAPPVTGAVPWWSPDGRTLTVAHAPFSPCTAYTATVDAGGADLSAPGNPIASPRTWSFSTVCAPVATLLAPLGGEQWTGGSTHTIRFRVSDEADVQLAAWVNTTGDGVPATVYAGPVPLGEVLVAWTIPSTTSTATVLVTVSDGSGLIASSSSAALAIDATPPALLTADPADGAVSASVAGPVVLTFSERMNEAATATAVAVTPSVGGMSAFWDLGGRVLTIEFASPLAAFTEYTVTVGCAARDGSDPGNALAGCPGTSARVRFTTEIVAPQPIALAAAVSDVRVGSPVGFDGRGSTGEIAAWAWTVTDAAGAVIATLDGPTATHTFSEPGTYRVTLRVTDAFGRTDEYSFDVSVLSVGGGDGNPWILVVGGAAVLAAILFAASEPGRVAIVTATAARVYGRKPKDEKDSEIRGAILYYVRVHPGDTYMDVKRNLDLNDGVVTYHLARLEKDGLVRSAIQGARKRYYPAGMRVPVENGGELHEIQQRILRFVAQEPGMPVAVLAEQLGVSGQLALYHLRKLAQGQQVDLERAGLRLRAYPGRPGK